MGMNRPKKRARLLIKEYGHEIAHRRATFKLNKSTSPLQEQYWYTVQETIKDDFDARAIRANA